MFCLFFFQLTSQHPYAEVFIGRPHVWTVDLGNQEEVEDAVKAILSQKVVSFIPFPPICNVNWKVRKVSQALVGVIKNGSMSAQLWSQKLAGPQDLAWGRHGSYVDGNRAGVQMCMWFCRRFHMTPGPQTQEQGLASVASFCCSSSFKGISPIGLGPTVLQEDLILT